MLLEFKPLVQAFAGSGNAHEEMPGSAVLVTMYWGPYALMVANTHENES